MRQPMVFVSLLGLCLLAGNAYGRGANSIVHKDSLEAYSCDVDTPNTASIVSVSGVCVPFSTAMHVVVNSAMNTWNVTVSQEHLADTSFKPGDKIRIEYWLNGNCTHCAAVRSPDAPLGTLWSGESSSFDSENWVRFSHVVLVSCTVNAGMELTVGLGADTGNVYVGGVNAFLVKKDIAAPALPWEIKAEDINDDGLTEIVMGSLSEKRLFCITTTGEILWQDSTTNAIVRDIAIGELHPDSTGYEVAVIWADTNHTLRAYSARGTVLWEMSHPDRYYSGVAIGDVDGDDANEVVCVGGSNKIEVDPGDGVYWGGKWRQQKAVWTYNPCMAKVACGDVIADESDRDYMVVPLGFSNDVGVFDTISKYDPDADTSQIPLSTSMDTGDSDTHLNIAVSVCLTNLDDDPALEILSGGSFDHGEFAAFDLDASDTNMHILWRYADTSGDGERWKYAVSIPMAGDLNGNGQDEVIAFTWNDSTSYYPRRLEAAIKVLSPADTECVGKSCYLRPGPEAGDSSTYIYPRSAFTCAAIQRGDNNDFLLLGSDFDDPNHRVFIVGCDPGHPLDETVDSLKQYVDSLEHSDPISSAHQALRNSVDMLEAAEKTPCTDKFHILLSRYLVQYGAPPYSYRKEVIDSFSTDNIQASMVWGNVREADTSLPPPTYGQTISAEDLLAGAWGLDTAGIPFWLEYAHADRRHFTNGTVRSIIDTAPNTLQGFVVLEYGNKSREAYWPDLVEGLKWLADTCEDIGLKIVLCGGGRSFMHTYADTVDSTGFNWMLDTAYRNVFVPMLKLNNCRSADKKLAELLGLWKAGYVNDIGYSTQVDNWRWHQFGPAAAVPPGVVLRQEMTAIASGARYLRAEGSQPYFVQYSDLSSAEKSSGDVVKWEAGTRYHRGLVYDLIAKRIVQPIEPSQLANVSKAGLLHSDPGLHGMSDSEIEIAERLWFLGTGGSHETIRPYNASSLISGVNGSHSETTFCPNPCGFWTTIPMPDSLDTTLHSLSWADTLLRTDGKRLHVDGDWDSAWYCTTYVADVFDSVSQYLPFKSDDCFMSVHELPGVYRLYLFGTAYYFAEDDTFTVKLQTARVAESVTYAKDILTGEKFDIYQDSTFIVPIAAGLFRIIEVARGPVVGGPSESIQDAVSSALPGDTVWVGPGTYRLDSTLTISKPVAVISTDGPGGTILDGHDSIRCVQINYNTSSVDSFVLLEGFTVCNGYSQNAGAGGILIGKDMASSDDQYEYNTVRRCIIRNNETTHSAGGGGIYCMGGHVDNCLIAYNSASCIHSGKGGGLKAALGEEDDPLTTVTNCTIVKNKAGNSGGGIYAHSTGFQCRNSIVYHNEAPSDSNCDNLYMTNCYKNSCVAPVPSCAVSCIDSLPRFVDSASGSSCGDVTFSGDFHLSGISACIDAGSNTYACPDTIGHYDLDLVDRVESQTVDMGCYEY